MSKATITRKVTVLDLRKMKAENRRITMLTAYDYTMARLVDAAGIDIVLVGDSLGMVVQGLENTLAVTLDQMIYHTRCVSRGLKRAHLVMDMPFMTYHNRDEALKAAGRALAEGAAEAVKMEGGEDLAETIRAVTRFGIPVMAHIGLTPQSVHALGGFKVQGRKADRADQIRRDAIAVEQAGAYSVVLEGIPRELATEISQALTIPTIGIGAGNGCDGQVLVVNDLLGMDEGFQPKFVKRYANLHETITGAIRTYAQEVREGSFPDEAHSFHLTAPRRREVA